MHLRFVLFALKIDTSFVVCMTIETSSHELYHDKLDHSKNAILLINDIEIEEYSHVFFFVPIFQ